MRAATSRRNLKNRKYVCVCRIENNSEKCGGRYGNRKQLVLEISYSNVVHFRLMEKSRIQKKRIIFSFTIKSKNINFFLFNPYYRDHMFLQAINAPQLKISSNLRSKSKVPANNAYSAQNSTFSHTNEYIILIKIH